MAVKRGGLGRGLDSLIPNKKTPAKQESAKDDSKKGSSKSTVKSADEDAKKSKAEKSGKKSTKTEKTVETTAKAVKNTKETGTTVKADKNTKETGTTVKAAKDTKEAGTTAKATRQTKKPDTVAKVEKEAPKSAAKSKATEQVKPVEQTKSEGQTKQAAPSDQIKQPEAPKVQEQPEIVATPAPSAENNASGDQVVMMKINLVEPNREQPRKEFDKEKLEELAESIRQYGVIQPLLVQKNDGYYEIIAGERRWRASQIAGIKEVPVIIRDYSKQEVVEVSLIENIQREDLNPIEEANAYLRLMDEFHMTQENIAKRVSKSRAAVTNAIRLLRLPDEVREMLIYGELTEGHARAILGLQDPEMQIKAARTVAQTGASVRDTEKLVKELLNPKTPKRKEKDPQSDLIYHNIEEQLKQALGTKVAIRRRNKSAGRIEIDYYSAAELERLLDLIRSVTG